MSVDRGVLDALRNALKADPEATGIRAHLARLLLEAGEAAEALDEFRAVLQRRPADVEALAGAAGAARQVGDADLADQFERLLVALGGPVPGTASPPSPASHPIGPAPESGGTLTEDPVRDPSAVRDDEEPVRLRVVDGRDRFRVDDDEAETIKLQDVGGMAEVKRRLEVSFLAPYRNPELRRRFKKTLRGGLLLYGPPGCGKTFLARALAGEMEARFVSVGITDVLDIYLGESERRLHEIFQAARRTAPTLLFFDEIDALGHKRSQLRGQAGRSVVNALLGELDGIGADNREVYVLAATNHPWDVDAALRRPGRFDRMVLVLPPDASAREAILRLHLRDRPAESVDVGWVAGHTGEFSGADLAHLCESATELAMEASVESGQVRSLTTADFKRSLKEVKPSTRSWFDTARNFAMFANEGGMYDDLLGHIKQHGY